MRRERTPVLTGHPQLLPEVRVPVVNVPYFDEIKIPLIGKYENFKFSWVSPTSLVSSEDGSSRYEKTVSYTKGKNRWSKVLTYLATLREMDPAHARMEYGQRHLDAFEKITANPKHYGLQSLRNALLSKELRPESLSHFGLAALKISKEVSLNLTQEEINEYENLGFTLLTKAYWLDKRYHQKDARDSYANRKKQDPFYAYCLKQEYSEKEYQQQGKRRIEREAKEQELERKAEKFFNSYNSQEMDSMFKTPYYAQQVESWTGVFEKHVGRETSSLEEKIKKKHKETLGSAQKFRKKEIDTPRGQKLEPSDYISWLNDPELTAHGAYFGGLVALRTAPKRPANYPHECEILGFKLLKKAYELVDKDYDNPVQKEFWKAFYSWAIAEEYLEKWSKIDSKAREKIGANKIWTSALRLQVTNNSTE